jgi:hypothetical protein
MKQVQINAIALARQIIKEAFEQDDDFLRSYVDNVAMLLYDEAQGAPFKVKEVRDQIAKSILKKIFWS